MTKDNTKTLSKKDTIKNQLYMFIESIDDVKKMQLFAYTKELKNSH